MVGMHGCRGRHVPACAEAADGELDVEFVESNLAGEAAVTQQEYTESVFRRH